MCWAKELLSRRGAYLTFDGTRVWVYQTGAGLVAIIRGMSYRIVAYLDEECRLAGLVASGVPREEAEAILRRVEAEAVKNNRAGGSP